MLHRPIEIAAVSGPSIQQFWSVLNVRFTPAVSMGQRNTRMKARRLDFGLQSLLELSEKLEQQWSPMIE